MTPDRDSCGNPSDGAFALRSGLSRSGTVMMGGWPSTPPRT
jgi:hypothetical protein